MVSVERTKKDKTSHRVKDFLRFSSLNFFWTILYFTPIIKFYPAIFFIESNSFNIFDIILFLCPAVE